MAVLPWGATGKAVGAKRPRPGLIHHSDRGSHYCAQDYQHQMQQFGCPLHESKGELYDNAPMENVRGTLKNELAHHRRHATREQAWLESMEYLEMFYNNQRSHSRMKNCSPAVFA